MSAQPPDGSCHGSNVWSCDTLADGYKHVQNDRVSHETIPDDEEEELQAHIKALGFSFFCQTIRQMYGGPLQTQVLEQKLAAQSLLAPSDQSTTTPSEDPCLKLTAQSRRLKRVMQNPPARLKEMTPATTPAETPARETVEESETIPAPCPCTCLGRTHASFYI